MPPKKSTLGTAQEWLKRAKGNLALAKQPKPKEIWQAINLTNYAVETRYPGPAEPVTRNEYRQAVALAEKVVKWAENIISLKRRK